MKVHVLIESDDSGAALDILSVSDFMGSGEKVKLGEHLCDMGVDDAVHILSRIGGCVNKGVVSLDYIKGLDK